MNVGLTSTSAPALLRHSFEGLKRVKMSMNDFARVLQQAAALPTCITNNGNTPANQAGYQYWYQDLGNNDTVVCTNESHCGWLDSPGNDLEGDVAQGMQYVALASCVMNLIFYAYHYWKATTGWEEVYVVVVELVKVALELTHQFESPATLYLNTGNYVQWIRYGEWMLTCPVILIHLSNITGLKDEYSSRTMMLLVSDIGCVVMGVTAAMCYSWPKWIFFVLGCLYGCNTYYHAAKVYNESYYIVPRGTCRRLVVAMAACFFIAWTMFPILFVIGPEGVGLISRYGSEIAHTYADILSKKLWGMLGHFLRVKVFEHMKQHGTLTSRSAKLNAVGIEHMNMRRSQDSRQSQDSYMIAVGGSELNSPDVRSMKGKSGEWVKDIVQDAVRNRTWEDVKEHIPKSDPGLLAAAQAVLLELTEWQFTVKQVQGWGNDEQVVRRLRKCLSEQHSDVAYTAVLKAVRTAF